MHYDVEMKGWIYKGCSMMCRLKGQTEKGHYDVQNKRVDEKGAIMMCKLKERMDK